MSDGDTITAALFNNEYNQLVNAFAYSSSSASSTGHRHDGTAGHGGNIHTIGDLDFLNKIVVDGTNNRWGFFVEVSSAAVEQIRIQDGAIVPVTDNDIDLGTSSLEFKDAYFDGTITTDLLTVSGTTNLDGAIQVDNTITVGVDDTGYDVKFFGDTASAYMLWDTSADDLVLAGSAGLDVAGDIDVDGTSNLDNTDIDGTLAVDGTTISLDATTSLNIDNSNTSNGITIGTATSGVPVSIGHTTSEVTVNDNLTVTGTLTLGSGAELTEAELEMLDGITAGTVAASKAVVVDSNKDAASFRNITLTGELDAATLDISGDADIDGTLEADAYTVDGTALNEYIADTVGAMVSSNTESGITVAYEDGDNTLDFTVGTLNQDTTGTADNITVSANNSTDETVYPIFVDGATGSQGAESDTGLTYNPSSGLLTISGELDAGSLDISGNADIDGTLEADAITVDGTALNEYIADTVGAMVGSNTETGITVTYEDGDNTLDFVIGTLNQDTTGNAATFTATANNSTDETVYPVFVDGATGSQGAETDTGFTYNPSSGLLTISGELDAGSLDVSGDADIDGTLEADAITIGGVTLAETIADTVGAMVSSNTESGITVAYQDADNTLDFTVGTLNQDTTGTAAIATTVTITDNESTNEENAVVFTAGGDVDGGNLGLESDGNLTYNPSSGTLTATAFAGALTGNVTGNASGTAATVTGAAQSNITSLGTLTTLTVDNVIVNGTTIGHTSDTDLMTLADGVLTVAGELDAVSLDISGDVDIDGTLETDNLTVGGAQGSDGQVLTSTGSGVAWEDAASGGASNVNGLSDAKTFGTSSIMIGDATTGTISGANYNVGLGIDVFESLTTGDNNVAIGFRALQDLTTGEQNVALGNSTLMQITTASNNTAVGQSALNATTTGTSNVAVGHEAAHPNTTGSSITAIGANALDANTTGDNNTAVGRDALGASTTAGDNTAVGYGALASTNHTRNMGIGYRALTAQSGSSDNIAIGYDALVRQTTGANGNIAIGNYAGRAVVSSASTSQLLAIGHSVASNASGALAGYQNVFIGYNIASTANLAGAFQNTALGGSAMTALSTGDQNTCIGNSAGDAITTGSNNVCIGYDAGSDAMESITTDSNNVIIGNNSINNAEVKVDWTVGSDERDKTDIENLPNSAGLNFVNQLRPVTYVWDNRSNYYKPTDEKYGERDHSKKSTTKQVGFIAQEVKAIEESIGWTEDYIVNTSNEQSYKLTYSQVIPMLTKAIQELSTKVEELEDKLKEK